MKTSNFMKWKKKFNSLSEAEKEKELKENLKQAVKNSTDITACVKGTISQFCSCFDNGKILYCFNLKESKKFFLYYLKNEEEEKIFKEGNVVILNAHIEHNSYTVDSIELKS